MSGNVLTHPDWSGWSLYGDAYWDSVTEVFQSFTRTSELDPRETGTISIQYNGSDAASRFGGKKLFFVINVLRFGNEFWDGGFSDENIVRMSLRGQFASGGAPAWGEGGEYSVDITKAQSVYIIEVQMPQNTPGMYWNTSVSGIHPQFWDPRQFLASYQLFIESMEEPVFEFWTNFNGQTETL
jgi:hypothetical protein